ncbi:MAG: mechanosensitive ion channel family protein [Deltaproteobacteria bacterium]|nr:MAG: mechanosensitive ion channel family protein [Deltaproteobacteria bacterium]
MRVKRGLRLDAMLCVWLGVLACVAGGSVASAQPPPAAELEKPAGPADQYNRGVPRSAMRGFLAACMEGDYARATEYLDLRRLNANQQEGAAVLARRLKFVLDQELWVEMERLSQQPEGHPGDDLPSYRDRVGTIQTEAGPVDILLQRVPRSDGVFIWKISAATVARIPALYDEFGFGPLEAWLPVWMLEANLFAIALWQWLALATVIVLAFLTSWLTASAVLALGRPLVERSQTDFDDRLLAAVMGPLHLVIGVLAFHLGTLPLGLAVPVRRVVTGMASALAVMALTWLVFRVIDIFGDVVEKRFEDRGVSTANRFVPLGRKALKAALGVLAVLVAIDSLTPFDVTALIAGLGVGGIAIALAAQKTLENVFGYLMIVADRPVSVGDFCRFGDQLGTVEEVGLRSTKLRTRDRTIVTVPNAEFSAMKLENFAKRDRIRFHTVLGLRYETTPDQLRHVLVEIRRLLLSHEMVVPDPARVRFVGFGAYSLDVEITSYVATSDWAEFLAVREDLLLRLMDIVSSSGAGFAFPSQTTYIVRDESPDGEKVRTAEEQVRAWRELGELPLPDFAEEAKITLDDSLSYPPEGSSTSIKKPTLAGANKDDRSLDL